MNKWKIAFWICFVLWIATAVLGFYSVLDQGVTITYMREDCFNTENDLKKLIQIINKTDLSKSGIKNVLKDEGYYIEFAKGDSISLYRITLCFKNNQLQKIKMN